MGEPLERGRLLFELAQRARVLGLVGPDDLGDGQRVEVIVPDEEDLEAPAAAKRADIALVVAATSDG